MKTPYTPGPYNVSFLENSFDSSESSLKITSPLPDGELLTLATMNVRAFAPHMKEPLATAALLAAAPELAEALQEMKRLVEVALSFEGDVFGIHHNDVMDAISNTDNALRKAGLLPA